MSNYSRGKIYTVRCRTDDTLIYVGSTIETRLSVRFCKHKCQPCCSLYKFIENPDNNTSWDNWYIELYEEYPCENKMLLVKRENEVIREIATINKIGYRTEEMKKEKEKIYREQNKELIKNRNKEYVEKNREKVLQRKREYNEKTKEYKSQYMKERYQENKEELKQKAKEYSEQNKDYLTEKLKCACGCMISRKCIREHERTKKHIDILSKQQ
jgi:hypothetical protein